jgi:polyhydroxybutyrate depolymerase
MTAEAGRWKTEGGASRRTAVLGAVLAVVFVPVAIVPVQAARFYAYNRDNGSFVSSGIERTYLLHVPKTYDASKLTPLVISLHGAGLWGVAQKDMSRWNEVSDAEGFIVAYPSGVGGRGLRVWHVEADNPRGRDNVFISELIDTLRAKYNIDTTRVYANGLSNGGGMAFGLSCALSGRLAAVGLVGSAQTDAWNSCKDTSAVPMINFHGTDDRFAAYTGGTSWVLPDDRAFPSQLVWTARWAKRNGCKAGPTDSVITATVTRRAYSLCAHGADVVLYTIKGGGHTWPGGGPHPAWFVGVKDRSIDASGIMWQFFVEHPRSRIPLDERAPNRKPSNGR